MRFLTPTLALLLPLLAACSIEKSATKAIGTSSALVGGAVAGWREHVQIKQIRGEPVPIQTELRVVEMLDRYYTAETAAIRALESYKTGASPDASLLSEALKALHAAASGAAIYIHETREAP